MPDKIGFWQNVTSTIDWCEINYEVTFYIVEFWNTISNLLMIFLPLYGLYWSFRQNSSKKFNKFRVPNSVLACFFALMMVGCGSWLFHMTLLYEMQLLDELPMVFGAGIALYALVDVLISIRKFDSELHRVKSKNVKSKLFLLKFFDVKTNLAILISFYCLSVAYVYVYIWRSPVFHQIAFGLIILLLLIIYFFSYFSFLRTYTMPNKLVALIVFYIILAFLFWNIDNNFCDYLREYRSSVENLFGLDKDTFFHGLIRVLVILLKSLSEFHSHWHLFTCYAAFLGILFLIQVNYEQHLRQLKILHQQRLIGSKLCHMYYFFTVNESEKNKCPLIFVLKKSK